MSRMNFIATGHFSSVLETLCGGHSGTVRGSASFPAHRAPQRPGGGRTGALRRPDAMLRGTFTKFGRVSAVKAAVALSARSTWRGGMLGRSPTRRHATELFQP